jgi:hypothetical protein
MRKFTILAVIAACALAASPLEAGPIIETPSVATGSPADTPPVLAGPAPETPKIRVPCDTFDCSRHRGPMTRTMHYIPVSIAKLIRQATRFYNFTAR